jgi:hypothetical protein
MPRYLSAILSLTLVSVALGAENEPPKAESEKKSTAGSVEAPTEKEDSKELKAAVERLRECRALFADGKTDEAIELGLRSIDLFVAAAPEAQTMTVAAWETEKYLVDVVINLGAKERKKPQSGIVRPYSFMVQTKAENPKFLYFLDFEHGYSDGEPHTAALGRMVGSGHINHGMFKTTAKFSEVEPVAMKLIQSGLEARK